MNIGIIGTRDFKYPKWVEDLVERLPHTTTIVSGHGGIVDKTAELKAQSLGLMTIIHPAKWYLPDGRFDKAAGYKRNPLIVRDSDIIFAFWDGVSGGTNNTLNIAKKINKIFTIIFEDGKISINDSSKLFPSKCLMDEIFQKK